MEWGEQIFFWREGALLCVWHFAEFFANTSISFNYHNHPPIIPFLKRAKDILDEFP